MQRKSRAASEMAGEMEQSGKLYKTRAPVYAEISAEIKGDMIADAVSNQRKTLERAWKRGKIDLKNIEEVQAGIIEYLTACEIAQVVPTLLGLSASFGMSRARIYFYCQQNPLSETAQAIEAFRTAAAAVIAQGSLSRALDNSTSIFLMKNSGQHLQDRHELEMTARAVSNSTDPEIVHRIEPYLQEVGIDYSEMSDDEKRNIYITRKYGGEDGLREYIEQTVITE